MDSCLWRPWLGFYSFSGKRGPLCSPSNGSLIGERKPMHSAATLPEFWVAKWVKMIPQPPYFDGYCPGCVFPLLKHKIRPGGLYPCLQHLQEELVGGGQNHHQSGVHRRLQVHNRVLQKVLPWRQCICLKIVWNIWTSKMKEYWVNWTDAFVLDHTP